MASTSCIEKENDMITVRQASKPRSKCKYVVPYSDDNGLSPLVNLHDWFRFAIMSRVKKRFEKTLTEMEQTKNFGELTRANIGDLVMWLKQDLTEFAKRLDALVAKMDDIHLPVDKYSHAYELSQKGRIIKKKASTNKRYLRKNGA